MNARRRIGSGSPQALAAGPTAELTKLFVARLDQERQTLKELGAELENATDNPVPMLSALRAFAHRVAGTAAIFKAPVINRAALELEAAAMSAIRRRANGSDVEVWKSLIALTGVLVNDARKAP